MLRTLSPPPTLLQNPQFYKVLKVKVCSLCKMPATASNAWKWFVLFLSFMCFEIWNSSTGASLISSCGNKKFQLEYRLKKYPILCRNIVLCCFKCTAAFHNGHDQYHCHYPRFCKKVAYLLLQIDWKKYHCKS